MALASQRKASGAHCIFEQRNKQAVRRAVRSSAVSEYQAPSTRTGANELVALSTMSNIVPDTILLQSAVKPKAATVSSLLLSWILANEQLGMKPYEVGQVSRRVSGCTAAAAPLGRAANGCMDHHSGTRGKVVVARCAERHQDIVQLRQMFGQQWRRSAVVPA